MKIRLFYKLFGTYLVIGVLAVVIAGFVIEGQLRSGLTRWIEDELTAEARIVALMPEAEIQRNVSALAERSRTRLTLVDAKGRSRLPRIDSVQQPNQRERGLLFQQVGAQRLAGRGLVAQ